MKDTHTHRCTNRVAGCTGTYECSNDYLERNHDPSGVVCGVDPLSEGECASCVQARQRDQCHDCGEPAQIAFEDADDASGYKGEIALCADCLAKRKKATAWAV